MSKWSPAVLGMFPNRSQAESGLDLLRLSGFRNADISAVMNGGAEFSGGLSWLTCGTSGKARAMGQVIVAGPIAERLAENSAETGAETGMAAALAGWGAVQREARRYEKRVRQGGVFVAIHCGNQDGISQAERALKKSGCEDVVAVERPAAAGA